MFFKREIKNPIFNNINGYSLDTDQRKAIVNDSNATLIVAGAGSGKTLTLLGKVLYLIQVKKVVPEDILVISFTNKTVSQFIQSLDKLKISGVKVQTFHKLAISILKKKQSFSIAPPDFLECFTEEYFRNIQTKSIKVQYFFKEYCRCNKNVSQQQDTENLQQLIVRFIHCLKANHASREIFKEYLLKYKGKRKEISFLCLTLYIYDEYQKELDELKEFDFDDLLWHSTNLLKNGDVSLHYRYLLVDEYQDISWQRYCFLQSILQNSTCKLVAVGDDWQSIYGFSGSTLELFTKFSRYFWDSRCFSISKTYRSSQDIVFVSSKFILKNKKQTYKKLITVNKKGFLYITFYKNMLFKFEKVVQYLISQNEKEVLVIGRNNKDLWLIVDHVLFEQQGDTIVYLKNPLISITFLTVHKAKGLEANNVILINLYDAPLGFPNQIKNDEMLNLIFPYSLQEEERRIFYVALTRSKKNLYLLVPFENASCFVKEIFRENRKKIKILKL